eukprot:30869-Pelagococcus_subviridis.AAC.5
MRRVKPLRNGVRHADAVVWGPVSPAPRPYPSSNSHPPSAPERCDTPGNTAPNAPLRACGSADDASATRRDSRAQCAATARSHVPTRPPPPSATDSGYVYSLTLADATERGSSPTNSISHVVFGSARDNVSRAAFTAKRVRAAPPPAFPPLRASPPSARARQKRKKSFPPSSPIFFSRSGNVSGHAAGNSAQPIETPAQKNNQTRTRPSSLSSYNASDIRRGEPEAVDKRWDGVI